MKVLFALIGPDVIASSRVRVLQFLPALRQNLGMDATIRVLGSSSRFRRVPLLGLLAGAILKRVRRVILYAALWYAHKYDLVFIHRVLPPVRIIWRLIKLRKPLVFDFDDSLTIEGFHRPHEAHRRLTELLRAASVVITSTSYNAETVRDVAARIEIIPSSVDTRIMHPKSEYHHSAPIVIGWIGSPSTTQYLSMIIPVLEELVLAFHVVLHFVGASRTVRIKGTNVVYKPWKAETEGRDVAAFDIGIMPLPDNEWTRGKGGYKLLQYMAAGVPVVASPVTVNREIVRHGENGFLAASNEEWFERLSMLVQNSSLRESMGRRGRQIAEEEYSAERACDQLIHILSGLRSH